MAVYKSPGIYVQESDWSGVYPIWQKKFVRKNKIAKIFDLEFKSVIITSTSKGPNNFPIISW